MKLLPQILVIIGGILTLVGGFWLFRNELAYRTQMLDNANRNMNIITGGEGYCYILFQMLPGVDGIENVASPQLYNDFEFPQHSLNVQIFDLDAIDKCPSKMVEGKKHIDKQCWSRNFELFELNEVPPKLHHSLFRHQIPINKLGTRYLAKIHSRNGVIIEKIRVIEHEGTKYVGYQIEKDGKVLAQKFHESEYGQYKNKFEWDFEFNMEESVLSSFPTDE